MAAKIKEADEVKPQTEDEAKPEGLRSITAIVGDLQKPVQKKHLKMKKQGGKEIWFLSWFNAVKYLNHFAPGWCYEIRRIESIAGKLILTTRISIPCIEGVVFREATGQEEETTDSWGDSSSNAESMSLRRACAKFGLGLYLYDENGYKLSMEENQPKPPQAKPPNTEVKPLQPEQEETGVAISADQLKVLIELCEKPPKRKEPCDKTQVAKYYSGGRTEMLEDLTAREAVRAMDSIRALTDKPK